MASKKKMPKQNRGQSRQDYGTPDDFFAAVTKRFGSMDVDLAATKENAKAETFISPAEDSLKNATDWTRYKGKKLWLNPPFAAIMPWLIKCASTAPDLEDGAIFLLMPASIGSNGFQKYVFPHALVLALNPRLTFAGEKHPYPKDCILAVYAGPDSDDVHVGSGFDVWRWK